MRFLPFCRSILFASSLILVGCKELVPTSTVQNISDGWQFKSSEEEEWASATVPGTVHTDLIQVNKIDDPFYRLNEHDQQWIDKQNWVYRTEFNIEASTLDKEFLQLDFYGLDTYAKVYLNDQLILTSDNMFRHHAVPVKGLLREASNELMVEFESPIAAGLAKHDSYDFLFPKSGNDLAEIGQVEGNKQVSIFSRKAGYHFGWDWGPRLVTSGIWKPISLTAWSGFRIKDVAITHELENSNAHLTAKVEAMASSSMKDQEVSAEVWIDGRRVVTQPVVLLEGSNTFHLDFDIENPELWWPNGLGEQPLYAIEVRLVDEKSVDSKITKVGLRDIELVRDPDSMGTSFYFKVNGHPVFMKGANYIPQDIFLTRPKSEDYAFLLKSAKESNMNMIRVWGGGIY